MLSPVIEKVRDWSHQRKLKRLGYTQEAWIRVNDPDIKRFADKVSDFYSGYPTVFEFTTTRGRPFTDYESWMGGYQTMIQWCKDNCQGKWREDIHRVTKQTGLTHIGDGVDWLETPEWIMCEIGGGDVLFFAFKDERDAMLFTLKWL
jgi:hypothetical protein